MAAALKCHECNKIGRCRAFEGRTCSAGAGADKKGRQKYCDRAFMELSGGVLGCAVHGIRQGRVIYLCKPCARDLGYDTKSDEQKATSLMERWHGNQS